MMPQRRTNQAMPAAVALGTETETGHGWSYAASIAWSDGSASEHTLTLSWVDHNHLTGGACAPSVAAEAALHAAAAELGPDVLRRALDVSTLCRATPAVVEAVRAAV